MLRAAVVLRVSTSYIIRIYGPRATRNVLPRALLVFAASEASAKNEIYHSQSKNKERFPTSRCALRSGDLK
jgi:hypothetical protein